MNGALLAEAGAGAAGQLIATLLLHPLDTLKTRQQASSSTSSEARAPRAGEGDADTSSCGRDGWMRTFLSLYTGVKQKAVLALLSSFVFFYGYEFYKRAARRRGIALRPAVTVAAASLAGANNVLVTQPLDTYVTRIQTRRPTDTARTRGSRENGVQHSACNGVEQIARSGAGQDVADDGSTDGKEKNCDEPKTGYYDGLGASLILCVNPGIQYAFFEQLKKLVLERNARRKMKRRAADAGVHLGRGEMHARGSVSIKNESLSALTAFTLGALSKCFATVITYPLIRGKVLQQVASGGDRGATPVPSLLSILRRIIAQDGLRGLYKGMETQILKTVLSAAIALMLKEKLSQLQRRLQLAMAK